MTKRDFALGIMIVLFAIYIFLIILAVKNEVTFYNRQKVLKAIYLYQNNNFKKHIDVDYDDMEDYDKTLYRWYDWSYKNILPKDKLEIIKPFMNDVR